MSTPDLSVLNASLDEHVAGGVRIVHNIGGDENVEATKPVSSSIHIDVGKRCEHSVPQLADPSTTPPLHHRMKWPLLFRPDPSVNYPQQSQSHSIWTKTHRVNHVWTRIKNNIWVRGEIIQLELVQNRPWLEYSAEKNAAYCFPCRVFGWISNKFTEVGYTDWRHALDGWSFLDTIDKNPNDKKKLKGFSKHVISNEHLENLSAWRKKEKREATGRTLQSVVPRLDNDNKKWLEVFFHVKRHLAAWMLHNQILHS